MSTIGGGGGNPGGHVLVLGATGFAGRHFADAAASAGMDVVRSARTAGAGDVACDLMDPESVRSAVRQVDPATIVNLAGASSVGESWDEPVRAFEANAIGTLNLLRAVGEHASAAHVVCISSGEAYGAPGPEKLPVDEGTPLLPINPYGASKAAMEVICGQYARASGLRIAVVRAFNHLGPGQSPRFAASSFARQIAEAETAGNDEVTLQVGNLSPERDFTDVRDMVAAYLGIVERGLVGVFNACSGRPTAIGRLVEYLRAATPMNVHVKTDEARMRIAETDVNYGSAAKLEEATGWEATIPLDRTLSDLLGWWRQELVREGRPQQAKEIR